MFNGAVIFLFSRWGVGCGEEGWIGFCGIGVVGPVVGVVGCRLLHLSSGGLVCDVI